MEPSPAFGDQGKEATE